ncbi:MAG: 3-keto-disaccharide hydrolase [Gemmatimonadales bacterium]
MLTAEEQRAGWRLLFDGRTAAGWRGFKSSALPAGWQAIDGALTRVAQAGDIVTDDQFQDFELTLEWKVAPGGNSGIFFRVSEASDAEWVWQTGPEMQVLDDARHKDGANPETSAGACYGLYPVPGRVARPAGEWNQVRLLVQGNHVEHWLNGRKVVEYELGSPDWEDRVRRSKFGELPRYGREPRGHIALQDHGDWVAYRNLKIRVLDSAAGM